MKITPTTLLAACLLMSPIIHAAGATLNCDNEMHCTVLTGLPNKANNGRFIRVEEPFVTRTACIADVDQGNVIPFDDYPYNAGGTVQLTYSICTDMLGDHCTFIGVDTFSYSTDHFTQTITSNPQVSTLNVPSNLVAEMPACAVTTGFH